MISGQMLSVIEYNARRYARDEVKKFVMEELIRQLEEKKKRKETPNLIVNQL